MNQMNQGAKKATPEQIRAYRRRLFAVILGNIVILLVGFRLMVLLMNLFHRNPVILISVGCGTLVMTGIGAKAFSFLYFRRPVCGGPIRGIATAIGATFGRYCGHCNIDFIRK
jgi:hypothetical protein